jgi:uncharacterized protein YdhG (YjbR/CyaY superfamily)
LHFEQGPEWRPRKRNSPSSAPARAEARRQKSSINTSRVPEPARAAIKTLRAIIRSAMPVEAAEIISYRIPAFKLERVSVWCAAFSDHCSLFPTGSVIEKFKDELKRFSTSKGTIHFPFDELLPAALIKKIVKARVQQSKS